MDPPSNQNLIISKIALSETVLTEALLYSGLEIEKAVQTYQRQVTFQNNSWTWTNLQSSKNVVWLIFLNFKNYFIYEETEFCKF